MKASEGREAKPDINRLFMPEPDTSDRSIARYINLGLVLPIATFVGFLLGYGLDKLFHTGWLRYVFLVIGTAAGFIDLIRELNKDV